MLCLSPNAMPMLHMGDKFIDLYFYEDECGKIEVQQGEIHLQKTLVETTVQGNTASLWFYPLHVTPKADEIIDVPRPDLKVRGFLGEPQHRHWNTSGTVAVTLIKDHKVLN